MGYYVNQTSDGKILSSHNKAEGLLDDGAVEVLGEDIKFQPNLVCVVDNFAFQAAAFAYSQEEFDYFNASSDDRPKRWFIYEHAAKLSGFKG